MTTKIHIIGVDAENFKVINTFLSVFTIPSEHIERSTIVKVEDEGVFVRIIFTSGTKLFFKANQLRMIADYLIETVQTSSDRKHKAATKRIAAKFREFADCADSYATS
jgi:hypothetical protein